MKKAIIILLSFLITSFIMIAHVRADLNDDLFEAVEKGDLKRVKLLIQKGANINVVDKSGRSFLHWATSNWRTDIAIFLINKGVNINVKDKSGNTPLHLTAMIGHHNMAKLFISRGAKVNAKNKKGQTPLDLQLAKKYKNTKLINLLKKHGANQGKDLK